MVRSTNLLLGLLAVLSPAAVHSRAVSSQDQQQLTFQAPTPNTLEEGVGHFSEWSRNMKKLFVDDWGTEEDGRAERMKQWTLVMGNEGGDLDSMASALTFAYHLTHVGWEDGDGDSPNNATVRMGDNGDRPWAGPVVKAVALLQTPEDALDLRPENKLALSNAKMSPGHRDLLTIDELPIPPEELAPMINGIVLVDHPVPLRIWEKARVVSIFDHHADRETAPDASPRVFQRTASCSTLVARYFLDALDSRDKKGRKSFHLNHELMEIILSAIALDSDALKSSITTQEDIVTACRLLKRSEWRKESLQSRMSMLEDSLKKAKKDLDELNVRDLIRRDWKGDVVDTISDRTPAVHLGFGSVPYSLEDQIDRTLHRNVEEWFEILGKFSEEVHGDISVVLNSFKVKVPRLAADEAEEEEEEPPSGQSLFGMLANSASCDVPAPSPQTFKKHTSVKRRQIVLTVRHDERLNEAQADELFAHIKQAIESAPGLDPRPWNGTEGDGDDDGIGKRRMIWDHDLASGGRKFVRPIVEKAVREWGL